MECYHMHDFFTREAPESSVIRWAPERFGCTAGLSPTAELAFLKQHRVDVVIFQKLSDAVTRELATMCIDQGIPTVFIICDYVEDLTMVTLCTATIVTSTNLLDWIKALHPQRDVTCSQYGTEAPPDLTPAYARIKTRDSRLVYLGAVRLARDFGFLNRIPGTSLTTIGKYNSYDRRLNSSAGARLWTDLMWRVSDFRHPDRADTRHANRPLPTTREWRMQTVYDDMASCDIGILPLLPQQLSSAIGKMKSNSRLLSMWGVGLATIASPLRAYAETINHGVDGFIAETRHDWIRLIKLLSSTPDLRREIGKNARARAFREFGLERQFGEYLAVFRRALERPVGM